MPGRSAERTRVHFAKVIGVGQMIDCQNRTGRHAGNLGNKVGRCHQSARGAILEAHGDALHRRIAVKRQPGRASLGDGKLGNQQIWTTLKPQADHVAGPHTMAQQAARQRGRLGVNLGIADLALARNHADGQRMRRSRRRKNLRQQLVS